MSFFAPKQTLYQATGSSTVGSLDQKTATSELGKRKIATLGRLQLAPNAGNLTLPSSAAGKHVQVQGTNVVGTIILPDPTGLTLSTPLLLENQTGNAIRVISQVPSTVEWGNLQPTSRMVFEVQNDGGTSDPLRWQQVSQDASVLKANTATLVPAGGAASSFPNLAAAVSAGKAGTDTYFLTGYQDGQLKLGKAGTYIGAGVNLGTQDVEILPFTDPIGASPLTITVRNFNGGGRCVFVRQNATCSVTVYDWNLDGAGYWELYGFLTTSTHVTTVRLVRCRSRRSVALTPGANNINGNVVFQTRSDYGAQRMDLILEDCDFVNTVDSCFTGSLDEGTITLLGTTKLTPKTGEPVFKLVHASNNSPVDLSTVVIDQRSSPSTLPVADTTLRATLTGYDETYWLNNRLQGTQPAAARKFLDDASVGKYSYEFVDGIWLRDATY